jgi:hypothetical protein
VPERFAGVPQLEASRGLDSDPIQSALVLVSSGEPETKIFGTQFVAGIVPFSQVYLQNSAQIMLEELTIDALQQSGFSVLTAPAEEIARGLAYFQPQLVIRPELRALDFSAYDALILRVVRLSGEIALQVYRPGAADPLRPTSELRSSVSETFYRRSAFGPFLSATLARELNTALNEILAAVPRSRRDPSPLPQTVLEQINPRTSITFLPPTFTPAAAEELAALGKPIAESYGYQGESPYSLGQLARVFLRGVTRSAALSGTPYLSVIDPRFESSGLLERQPSWVLRTELERVRLHGDPEQLEIQALLTLGERGSHLARARCSTVVSRPSGVDGVWVEGLSRAGSQLASALLNRGPECEQLESGER